MFDPILQSLLSSAFITKMSANMLPVDIFPLTTTHLLGSDIMGSHAIRTTINNMVMLANELVDNIHQLYYQGHNQQVRVTW